MDSEEINSEIKRKKWGRKLRGVNGAQEGREKPQKKIHKTSLSLPRDHRFSEKLGPHPGKARKKKVAKRKFLTLKPS